MFVPVTEFDDLASKARKTLILPLNSASLEELIDWFETHAGPSPPVFTGSRGGEFSHVKWVWAVVRGNGWVIDMNHRGFEVTIDHSTELITFFALRWL